MTDDSKWCVICGSWEADYDGEWCDRCHRAYLEGWMDTNLVEDAKRWFKAKGKDSNDNE
jgi:hypothetical protein